MGSAIGKKLNAKHRRTRGTHEEGEVINDPKDWIVNWLVDDRDNCLEMFNQLSDDQKAELNNCFGDGNA